MSAHVYILFFHNSEIIFKTIGHWALISVGCMLLFLYVHANRGKWFQSTIASTNDACKYYRHSKVMN